MAVLGSRQLWVSPLLQAGKKLQRTPAAHFRKSLRCHELKEALRHSRTALAINGPPEVELAKLGRRQRNPGHVTLASSLVPGLSSP